MYVNREPVRKHILWVIEWAYPRPPPPKLGVDKTPLKKIAAKRLEIDENVNRAEHI